MLPEKAELSKGLWVTMVPEWPLASSAELLCASGRATGSKRPTGTLQEHRLGGAPQQPHAHCWSSWVLLHRSTARLLRCHCCLAVWLLALGTCSHHVPPALLVRVLLLRKLHLTTAYKAPSRFTVFHYCVSGTWRRTAACVLCTLTSDRTLAGNGSTSLRATLLISVQALVHTFAAQTPLTARYILYIILPGLVAVLASSSLSLINIQSLQSSISSSDQYL